MSRSVSAVSMATSEYCSCPPRLPTPTASHVAIASGVNHRVTSPRWTSARSYAGQFPTRYFVLYLGCTLDFTSRSCPFGRHDGQGRDEHLFPRTNAALDLPCLDFDRDVNVHGLGGWFLTVARSAGTARAVTDNLGLEPVSVVAGNALVRLRAIKPDAWRLLQAGHLDQLVLGKCAGRFLANDVIDLRRRNSGPGSLAVHIRRKDHLASGDIPRRNNASPSE